MMARCLSTAGCLLLLALGYAHAQTPSCQARVLASVHNRNNLPVALQPASLVAAGLGGAIVAAIAPAPPRRVALLVDHSGTAKDSKTWAATEAITEAVLRALPAGVSARVAAFATGFRWVTPYHHPAADLAAPLAQAFRDAHPSGGTAFYDAVGDAAHDPELHAGDALIVVSDGGDDASRATGSQAAAVLVQKQLALVLMQVGHRSDNPYLNGFLKHAAAVRIQAQGALTAQQAAPLARRAWNRLDAQVMVTVTAPQAQGNVRLKLAPAPRQAGDQLLSVAARCQSR